MAGRVRHVETSVPKHAKSVAYLSGGRQENIERAVIFIHGYDGDAKKTWTSFLSLVDDQRTASAWWESADLYFYDYHQASKGDKVSRNKFRVAGFIKTVFPTPPQDMFDAVNIPLRREFSYKALTFVGHSQGGLILRKIIIDAAGKDSELRKYMEQFKRPQGGQPISEPDPKGLLQATVRLFAPAIGGESITGALGILTKTPSVSSVKASKPAIASLAPTSAAVTSARTGTYDYAGHTGMECFRAHILWADDDEYIEPEKYQHDFECENLPDNTTHASICKPTKKFLLPIKFVEEGVVDGEC